MIFHTPDPTFKRLLSCWRRAERNAVCGKIDKSHTLAAAWENAKMFMDSDCKMKTSSGFVKGFSVPISDIIQAEKVAVANEVMKLFALDWFALKVEEFSKISNIAGDIGLAHILHEWRERMPMNPTKLSI